MAKKKFSKKFKQKVQDFYDESLTDEKLLELTNKLSTIPEQNNEYFALMDEIFEYLDEKCKSKLLPSSTPGKSYPIKVLSANEEESIK